MKRVHLSLAVLLLAFVATPASADRINDLFDRVSRDVVAGAYEDGLQASQALEGLVRSRWGTSSTNYAAVMHNEGLFLHNLGRYNEAIQKLEIAYQIKSHNRDVGSFIRTANLLSATYEFIGELDHARVPAAAALQAAERSFGPNDVRVAEPLLALGAIEQDREQYGAAEDYIRRAVALYDQTPNADINDRASAYAALGDLYERDSRFSEAEKQLQRAQTLLNTAFGARAAQSPAYTKLLDDLANLYMEEGRYSEAEAQFKRLIDIENAKPPNARPNLASDLGNLGRVYDHASRYAEAEDLFKRTIALYEQTYGPQHPTLAIGLESLANIYVAEGRPNDALALQDRVLAIREKAYGSEHPDVARALTNLAHTYTDMHRPEEAARFYHRALAIFDQKFGADNPQSAVALSSLGLLEEEQKKCADGETHLQAVLRINEKTLGRDHPHLASDLNNLAHLEIAEGNYDAARDHLNRALALAEPKLGKGHFTTMAVRFNLADIAGRQGDWLQALRWLRLASADGRALPHNAQLLGLDAALVRALRHVADASDEAGLSDEAFQAAQRAHETSAGAAVSQMAARFAGGSDSMATAIRRQQDLQAQLDALDRLITAEIGKPDNRRNDAGLTRLRLEHDQIKDQLDATKQNLVKEFPAYSELSSPALLSIAQAQALLKADEALVFYNVQNAEMFVSRSRQHRLPGHVFRSRAKRLSKRSWACARAFTMMRTHLTRRVNMTSMRPMRFIRIFLAR